MTVSPFTPEKVLACARTIRAFLPELLHAEMAQQMDGQLATLLAQAQAGASVTAEILDVLKSQPDVQRWAGEFLSPTSVPKGVGEPYSPLPGWIGAIAAPCYICPKGDFVWYRRSVGTPIPKCPSHPGMDLVHADKDAE